MTDAASLAAMRILSRTISAVFLAAPRFLPLVACEQVRLSVQHGIAPGTAYAFAIYGVILCGLVGDLDGGNRHSTLALELLERSGDRAERARVLHVVHVFTRPWKEHVRSLLPPILEGWKAGLETGDFEYTAYNGLLHSFYSYLAGRELPVVEREIAGFAPVMVQLKQEHNERFLRVCHQAVLNLMGSGAEPWRLRGEVYDEQAMLPRHHQASNRTGIFFVHFNRMVLEYLFGRADEAAASSALCEPYLDAVVAVMCVACYWFYDALIHLSRYRRAAEEEQPGILARVDAGRARLRRWAEHAPMNYRHKLLLVEAERARVTGERAEAMVLYPQAVELAHTNQYLQEEALTWELAARCYREAGLARLADACLLEAWLAYQRWGAAAKVAELAARFPSLHERAEATGASGGTTESMARGALDLTSILKASQAISREIVLDQLVERLMQISVEYAGADRGVLVLQQDGQLQIVAESRVGSDDGQGWDGPGLRQPVRIDTTALEPVPLGKSSALPEAVVRYVARTRENLVLEDAVAAPEFAADPYLRARRPKSILCAPLLNQGQLSGILYLENNLAAGAFTEDHIEVLNLLTVQAAISVDNARMHQRVERSQRLLAEYNLTARSASCAPTVAYSPRASAA